MCDEVRKSHIDLSLETLASVLELAHSAVRKNCSEILISLSSSFLQVIRGALKGNKRDTILLLGLSGAGKTALFYQVRGNSWNH